jgi:IMP dehydrogenase
MQKIYAEPIKSELIGKRVAQIREAGVPTLAHCHPRTLRRTPKRWWIRASTSSSSAAPRCPAEHVSSDLEPLNLKKFIYELDVPVIVGGCATYQTALHLMRTGAAGVLVGFGGGAAYTSTSVLGVAVPMASAVSDVRRRTP